MRIHSLVCFTFRKQSTQGIIRTYNSPQGRIIKVHYHSDIWDNLIEDVNSLHGACEKALSINKERSGEHTKILRWISEENPKTAYRDILERTKVVDRYQDCGKWLFDTPMFQGWSSESYNEDYSRLWLRGTGLYLFLPGKSYVSHCF